MKSKRKIKKLLSLFDKMISALDTDEDIFIHEHPILSKQVNAREFSEKEKKENDIRIEVLTAEIVEAVEEF